MSIYLDIIFIENLLMNYIILFAVSVVMKIQIKQIRLILSSAIGSIYAIIVYLNIIPISSSIFMKIILSIVMTYVAFYAKNVKRLIKELLMFYLISFIFGGCTIALIYFIKPENVKIKNGVFVGTYPIKVALFGGGLAFIITQIAFKITKNKLSSKDMICDLYVYYGEKNLKIKALIDSGNMLKEPISGMPVVVIEKESAEKIIPQKLIKYSEEILNNKNSDEYTVEDMQYISKIRMIPFMSLGKQNGMLAGIKIKKIKIIFDDKENEIENVVLGIYDKKISKDNKYNALIGLEILERSERTNEFVTNS